MLAKCSCDNDLRDLEREVKDEMEGHDGKESLRHVRNNQKKCACNKIKSASNGHEPKAMVFTRRDSGVFWGQEDKSSAKGQTSIHITCQCNKVGTRSRPDSHLKNYMDNKATIHHQKTEGYNDDEEDIVTEEGLLFKDRLNKELGPTRRGIRMKLYESGIIESVGPWLVCKDRSIKVKLFTYSSYIFLS